MIYSVNRCPLRIWARSTSRISRQALFTSGIKSEKYTCLPSLRVPTMPAAFKIATCCERLALEIPSSVWSSEAIQSRLPRQSSIRRRVELAKDLQIRACRSKISESGLGRFLLVLATDCLGLRRVNRIHKNKERSYQALGVTRPGVVFDVFTVLAQLFQKSWAVRTRPSRHQGSRRAPCWRLKK